MGEEENGQVETGLTGPAATSLVVAVPIQKLLPVSQRIRSPRKSDPGRIRYASGFDPTSADSIRGINGPVRFLLSIRHSELCYIRQYSCSSDLAKPRLRVYKYYIFVRVFLDSGSKYDYNLTRKNECPCQNKTTVWSEINT